MTKEQQTALNDLWVNYTTAKKAYEIEVGDNYRASEGLRNASASPNQMYEGHHLSWWQNWKTGSDASLIAKKKIMDSTLSDYELYKADIAKQEQIAFNAANPQLAVQIHQANLAAQNQAEEIKQKAQVEAAKANYAASTSKFFLIGTVVVFIILGVTYFVVTSKQKPA